MVAWKNLKGDTRLEGIKLVTLVSYYTFYDDVFISLCDIFINQIFVFTY